MRVQFKPSLILCQKQNCAEFLSSYSEDIHGLQEELRYLRSKPLIPWTVPVDIFTRRGDVKVTWRRLRRELEKKPAPLLMDNSIILNYIFTLDDETKAEAAKGQIRKHRLFLWLPSNVAVCRAVVELKGQCELSGLNVLFDLTGRHMKREDTVHKQLGSLQILVPVK